MSSSSLPPPRPRRRQQIGVPEVAQQSSLLPVEPAARPAAPTERVGPKRIEVEVPKVEAPHRVDIANSDTRAHTTTMASSGRKDTTGRPRSPSRPEGVKVDLRKKSKERGRAKRRLILHRVLVFLLVAVVALVLGWVAFFSPLFALKADRSIIEGAQSTDVDQSVVERVVIPIVEGYEGTPLTRLPTGKIRADLLASPSVLNVEVTRQWPSGLKVLLTQRIPVAMVQIEGGYSLVGSDGAQISEVGEPAVGLPLVAVSATEVDKVQEQAAAAVEVWESLPQALREQVNKISVSGSIVTLELTSEARVIWGSAEESELKAQVLEILVEQVPATTFDLRDPRTPVTS